VWLGVQYQRLIVSGELPCCKEEAATLAAIQLHVDDTWPDFTSDQDDPDDDAMATEPLHAAAAAGDLDHQALLVQHNGTGSRGRRQRTPGPAAGPAAATFTVYRQVGRLAGWIRLNAHGFIIIIFF